LFGFLAEKKQNKKTFAGDEVWNNSGKRGERSEKDSIFLR